MRRALLAWETGGGRGHLTALRTVAEALVDRFSFDAAICDPTHAALLQPVCAEIVRGPRLLRHGDKRIAAGSPPRATWGEYLGDIGFLNEEFLVSRLDYWMRMIRSGGYDLVVADLAPLALAAARTLGVATATVGVGYFIPPSTLEAYPLLVPEHAETIHDEAEMLAVFNRAAAQAGARQIERLPEIMACDHALVCSLPMLDPYSAMRTQPYLRPIADVANSLAGGGREIFCYFSTTELHNPHLVAALGHLPAPTRAFLPGAGDALRADLAGRGVLIETEPVPVDLLVQRTGLVIHAAQHGIMSLALAAGIPQIAFPQHVEQDWNARCGLKAGVLRRVSENELAGGALQDIVADCLADRAMRERAGELARRLRPVFAQNLRVAIRRRLMMV